MCNDSFLQPNAKMQVVGNVKPSLCIFAIKDIPKYTEIRYNYGGSDLWWRHVSIIIFVMNTISSLNQRYTYIT